MDNGIFLNYYVLIFSCLTRHQAEGIATFATEDAIYLHCTRNAYWHKKTLHCSMTDCLIADL